MSILDLGKLKVDAALVFNRASWFTPDTLPVVGLDTISVQDTIFALRALDHHDRGIADAYLRAVQCAQLANDRLLRNLHEVDRHLSFWQAQMASGGRWSHMTFMLLSRGPVAFTLDVLAATRQALTSLHAALLSLAAAAQEVAAAESTPAPAHDPDTGSGRSVGGKGGGRRARGGRGSSGSGVVFASEFAADSWEEVRPPGGAVAGSGEQRRAGGAAGVGPLAARRSLSGSLARVLSRALQSLPLPQSPGPAARGRGGSRSGGAAGGASVADGAGSGAEGASGAGVGSSDEPERLQQQRQQESQKWQLEEEEDQQGVLGPVDGDGAAGVSATDMMQKRVLLLRALRLRLARALAELEEAAAHLQLGPLLELHAARLGEPPAAAASLAAGAALPLAGSRTTSAPPLTGFAASPLTAPVVTAAAASHLGGSGAAAVGSDVEAAILLAVRGMAAALESLQEPTAAAAAAAGPQAGLGQAPCLGPEHSTTSIGPNSNAAILAASAFANAAAARGGADGGNTDGGGSDNDTARRLAEELARLLVALRLRPLAARVIGLPEHALPAAVDTVQARAEALLPSLEVVSRSGSSRWWGPAGGSSVLTGGGTAGCGPGGAVAEGGALQPLVLTAGAGGTARSALDAARRAAALSGPMLPLPPSACMPSRFQRHWLRYGAAAGLLLYGSVFLFRHSRLAGSNDLDRWLRAAAAASRAAFQTHVAEPLAAVRDELFRTFRDRPAIVSADDFALSRESLLRMLAQFAADHPQGPQSDPGAGGSSAASSGSAAGSGDAAPAAPPGGGSAAANSGSGSHGGQTAESAAGAGGGGGGAGGGGGGGLDGDSAVAAGMAVLMRSYEDELRSPLRNLLLGDLARALLIQVQHVKVDGEAAMLRLDQILRANELSISLMAALPAMAVAGLATVGLARLLIPRAPDPRREAVPSRLAMAALEVALEELARAEQEEEEGVVAARQQQQQQQEDEVEVEETAVRSAASAGALGLVGGSGRGPSLEELRGVVVYKMYRAYAEVAALYATADRTSRFSEWPQLHADLLRLARPAAAQRRLATHRRIMRTYAVFQQ